VNRICIISVAFAVSACTTTPPPVPPPEIITIDVPTIVQRPCADRRGAEPDYPATDEKIAAIPEGDFELLGRVYRVDRDLRIARLREDDVQIKGCALE